MKKNPKSLEERIADALQESEQAGELQRARGYGKPLDFGDGYDETPAELRMGYKILKDAGAAPVEVEMLREVKALERQLAGLDAQSGEAQALRRKILEIRTVVSLRIEAMSRRSKT
jgi:hypothetical protein